MIRRGRGGICPCRHCRQQCKIFASGVNFSLFTHFLCFFPLKLLKLGEIDGVKFLAWKSGGVNFWTNSMSDSSAARVKLQQPDSCYVKLSEYNIFDIWLLFSTFDGISINLDSFHMTGAGFRFVSVFTFFVGMDKRDKRTNEWRD